MESLCTRTYICPEILPVNSWVTGIVLLCKILPQFLGDHLMTALAHNVHDSAENIKKIEAFFESMSSEELYSQLQGKKLPKEDLAIIKSD